MLGYSTRGAGLSVLRLLTDSLLFSLCSIASYKKGKAAVLPG
jgi:hypothetical protein